MGPITSKSFTPRKMRKAIMDLIKDSKIPLTALQVKNGINLSMLVSFFRVIN